MPKIIEIKNKKSIPQNNNNNDNNEANVSDRKSKLTIKDFIGLIKEDPKLWKEFKEHKENLSRSENGAAKEEQAAKFQEFLSSIYKTKLPTEYEIESSSTKLQEFPVNKEKEEEKEINVTNDQNLDSKNNEEEISDDKENINEKVIDSDKAEIRKDITLENNIPNIQDENDINDNINIFEDDENYYSGVISNLPEINFLNNNHQETIEIINDKAESENNDNRGGDGGFDYSHLLFEELGFPNSTPILDSLVPELTKLSPNFLSRQDNIQNNNNNINNLTNHIDNQQQNFNDDQKQLNINFNNQVIHNTSIHQINEAPITFSQPANKRRRMSNCHSNHHNFIQPISDINSANIDNNVAIECLEQLTTNFRNMLDQLGDIDRRLNNHDHNHGANLTNARNISHNNSENNNNNNHHPSSSNHPSHFSLASKKNNDHYRKK